MQNMSSFFQTVAMVTKITNLEQKSHDSMVKTIGLAHFQATVYSYIFDTKSRVYALSIFDVSSKHSN